MSKTKMSTRAQREFDNAISVLSQNPQITTMLGVHRDGMALVEFTTEIAKCLEGVRRSGKKGHVCLKFTFEPTKGDFSQLHVGDEITSKIPKPDVASKTMFIGDQNLPVYSDPAQAELRDLDEEERPVAKEIE